MGSGITVGPTIIAIFLRFVWTTSRAKDRHLKFEASGDQICSRKANGYSGITSEFVILPDLFNIYIEINSSTICRSFSEIFHLNYPLR